MKTLKGILEQSKMRATPDTERFVAKHSVSVKKLSKETEDDKLFNATNITPVNRETQHGYNPGSDEAVYEGVEQVDEKHLTPAEMKKREQIAKAMERSQPGMDKSKKMAIATATAKRVAEDVEQIDEGEDAKKRYNEYCDATHKLMGGIQKHLDTHMKLKGENPHWGTVGDIRSVHDQLRDIHDRLAETGEYAKADAAMQKKYAAMKEDINESVAEDQYVEIIESILEDLTEEERVEFLELMETEEGCAEVVEMLDQVFASDLMEEEE